MELPETPSRARPRSPVLLKIAQASPPADDLTSAPVNKQPQSSLSADSSQAAAQQQDPNQPNAAQPPELWKFLWPLIWPYRWLAMGALVLNALHGLAITFQNIMPKYLIDQVILAHDITTAQRYHRLAWLIAGYLFACIFARMLVWHVGYRMFTFVREKVMFGMRVNFFRHVNHLCLRFHIKNHSGELFSYLFGTPLAKLQEYFQQFTFGAPGAFFVMLSTLIWLGSWDWMMSAVLLLTVLCTVLLMQHTRQKVQSLFSDYQKVETSVSGYVADLLRGSRDVKLYAMEEKVGADFEKNVWDVGKKSYERDVRSHVQWMKAEAIGYVAFAVLSAVAAWRYLYDQSHKPPAKQITVGEIQAYLTGFITLQGSLTTLFNVSTLKGAAQAGLNRIDNVLRTASTTPDPIGEPVVVPRQADIHLRDVTFGYDANRPVLHQINLTIPYGQKVALVGPSGAGKSTVTQLLLRLYDPDQGVVLLGDVDLRHCSGPEIRQRFGVVPQDPFIFRTTLRDNLCVARPDATLEQMQRACELANAWEFINKLPQGLSTRVGEGGSTLSGGQRQRLAIARALLADPDYFIFDEATSALDTFSEHLVQQAMENCVTGRTALIIAHRLATVKNCDRILVTDGGKIAQDGTYDELLTQPGIFQNLVQGQVLRS
jgi:ABC-type multidrug transport system fused ATPase/permease subunit